MLALTAAAARAAGFDLPDQDAFAVARGMAFVATADNPSAIYYNPAGITQLTGNNLRGGLYGLYINTTYTSPTSGQEFKNSKDLHVLPSFYYTHTFEKTPLSVGLGFYMPFGLSSEWSQDTGFRSIALSGDQKTSTINPVIAWQIAPNLSVGAGPTISYGSLDLSRGLTGFPNYDGFSFSGDDWAPGFNLGALWKPCAKISLGVSYRSSFTMDYQGHTDMYAAGPIPGVSPAAFNISQTASASMPMPRKVISGISYRPTPAWNIEFNADWTDWSQLNAVTIQQAMPVPALNLFWKSSWYFELGGTHYFGEGWRVSAGYIYSQNSVPDENYNPLVSDLNRQFLSAGIGRRWKALEFDLAYQFGFSVNRTVAGSTTSAAGQTANGDYQFFSQALFLSVGWHF